MESGRGNLGVVDKTWPSEGSARLLNLSNRVIHLERPV